MTKISFQTAKEKHIKDIWQLRLNATEKLKNDGVDQWQFEDPKKDVFLDDISKNQLYVMLENKKIIGMFALVFGIEPTYHHIKGQWRYDEPYATIHRLALINSHQQKGYAKMMLTYAEKLCLDQGVRYMRIDTHRHNISAQSLIYQLNYVYCGDIEVDIIRGDKHRLAYDKLLELKHENIR